MSEFKVGDKVYMRHDPEEWGIISEICEDNYKHPYVVKTKYFEEMYAERELLGAKEAFLERLQKLLREFDASFIAHKTDMPISVYCGDRESPIAQIGKEVNRGCGVIITADNIMDFDKE